MRWFLTSMLFATLFFAGCSDDDDNNTAAGGSSGNGTSIPAIGTSGLLSVGTNHNCLVNSSSGGVECWGLAAAGRLGNSNPTVNRNGPTGVLSIEDGDGFVTPTVTNGDGPGGRTASRYDSATDSELPLEGIERVEAGGDHTCALGFDGGLRCWGANNNGQVGRIRLQVPGQALATRGPIALESAALVFADDYDNISTTAGTLTNILSNDFLYGVMDFSVGANHTCAVYDTPSESGVVSCWGLGTDGQLGVKHLLSSTFAIFKT